MSMDKLNASFLELTVAGSESTAVVLSGAINKLIQDPDRLAILVDEIRTRFKTFEEITFDALRDLKYLNAVINEALRLTPPLQWIPSRQVPPEGATVCGKWLPGGVSPIPSSPFPVPPANPQQAAVSISLSAMQRSPTSFHEPSSFRPERWFTDLPTNPTSPFHHDRRVAVKSFLFGSRTCLGQRVAWARMRMTLAKLLWTVDVALPEDKGKWVEWEKLKCYLVLEKKPIVVEMRLLE